VKTKLGKCEGITILADQGERGAAKLGIAAKLHARRAIVAATIGNLRLTISPSTASSGDDGQPRAAAANRSGVTPKLRLKCVVSALWS
jgi:hypothetical protein